MDFDKKIYSLQIIRAIAAWMVVLHHIGFDIDGHARSTNTFWLFFARYGSVGVDIFFVLSGFVITLISKNYVGKPGLFLVKRTIRILPNYWFYTILMALSLAILPSEIFFTTELSLRNLMLSLAFLPHQNLSGYGFFPILTAGWTLNFEMFFYLIFALALALAKSKAYQLCFCMLIVTILIVHFSILPNFLGNNIFMLFEFAIGIGIYHYLNIWGGKPYLTFNAILALIGFFLAIFFWRQLGFSGYTKIALATSILFIGAIFNHLLNIENTIIKFFIFLGDISFSTYLANLIVVGWISFLFFSLEIPFSENTFGLAVIINTFLFSYFTWRHIERTPYKNL